jgi:hypothetical protein
MLHLERSRNCADVLPDVLTIPATMLALTARMR